MKKETKNWEQPCLIDETIFVHTQAGSFEPTVKDGEYYYPAS